jgi:hypothetical protein
MTYAIDHWNASQAKWVHITTVQAFSKANATTQVRPILPNGPFRVQAISNGPDAGITPMSLPWKPTTDPTFYRPKGYKRPPSPAARRKQSNPR